jgi:DNA-binding response OmpR family regulator
MTSTASSSRILIVDDEAINLELFEVMLSRLGFAVEMARDGVQALELLPKVRPDLIVLDNIMPRLTGWEVTRRIKNAPEFAAFRQVPIIMFTAMDEIADRIEGLELGVDDYITKPFNFSEVLARIRAVLHRHELAGQLARREHRLGIIEALNESLIFFSQHVRRPLEDQVERAAALLRDGGNDPDALRAFAATAADQARDVLTTLSELEEQISAVHGEGERLKEGDLSLEELQALIHDRLSGHEVAPDANA